LLTSRHDPPSTSKARMDSQTSHVSLAMGALGPERVVIDAPNARDPLFSIEVWSLVRAMRVAPEGSYGRGTGARRSHPAGNFLCALWLSPAPAKGGAPGL